MVDTSIIKDFHEFISTELPIIYINTVELQFYRETGEPNYAYFDLLVEIGDLSFSREYHDDIVRKLGEFFKSKGFFLDTRLFGFREYANFGISVMIYFRDKGVASIMRAY